MIKLFGSLMLAITGVVLAVSVCRFEQKKLKVLDGFIALLFYIKGQVDCYNLPLCDILSSSSEKFEILGRCEKNIDGMLARNRIYLGEESYRLLERFFDEFGSTYREEQLKRTDYYIEALSEERRILFDDLPARTRVGGALCICSVIGILIILW